ncbi:MAG: hypothetical protein CVV13_08225 [Gammaproteobacteria bacterium HGW-Gammaproteobacteria-3]|nr:MAG: hypothetical protein CVV13_08225 [Gammaproteobacteria bacterium HGW-Gammaproteobacteria-3]
MMTVRYLSSIAGVFLLMTAAWAKPEAEPTATVSAALYEKLQKTDRLLGQKAYQKARQQLEALLGEAKSGTYEEATVLRSLSSVYALQENYAQAAEYLNKALALKVLPDAQQQQAVLNLGQLYLAAGQSAKAVATLTPWLAQNPNPDAPTHAMIANAYTQLKQYQKALPHINQAIQATKKPDEAWYQLQLALYYEVHDYSAAARVLLRLIRLYPDEKNYWVQLTGLYQQMKDYPRAATIKHLAYKKGLLTSEQDIVELAKIYLYIGAPYKAAALLEQELAAKRLGADTQHRELLANAWILAKAFDNAIKALQAAAGINDKARLHMQLGQLYFEREQWREAIAALKQALAKGGLKDPGSAYLMLGISHYESGDKTQARKAFAEARQYAKHRKAAEQWLSYAER